MSGWPTAVIGSLLTYVTAVATDATEITVRSATTELVALSAASLRQLKVRRVRLERADQTLDDPRSLCIKFDIINQSTTSISNLVFQVLLVEDRADASAHILAGPFTVVSKSVLDAENAMALELLIRDVPAACVCRPLVRIVSASIP